MKIRISEDLELNAEDFLESAIGVIGKRGGGKSGGIKVIMEELVRVGLPFVSFDPVGVMWGIKSSLDGKSEGLPILVIGGSHGDLRLDRRAGAQVATAVVQANVSCIIDFSEEPKAAYREFVKDFCHKLFAINDTPRLVILEEAPELVPQKLRPDMTEVFEAVERLVSRGRNKGIGVIMVSQRAATINKDVLTQVDALMIFGLVSPQDRKALTEWVEAWDQKGRIKEFEAGLAGLQRQEAWFWAPTLFKQGGLFQKIRIRNFKTFHPDKTHLRRTGLLEQKPITTDVSKIIAKLGAQLERFSKQKAEVASIPKMQVRIHQLEKDLETAKSRQPAPELSSRELKAKIEEAKRPLLEEVHNLKDEVELTRKGARQHVVILRKLKQVIMEATDLDAATATFNRKHPFPTTTGACSPKYTSPSPLIQSRPVVRTVSPKTLPRHRAAQHDEPSTEDDEISLKSGAVRMLRELARRYPATFTRSQVGTLAGFTPSGGTFSDYFSKLKRLGFIAEDHQGNVSVTDTGLDYVGEVPPAPSTHDEIVAMWKNNLKSGVGRMLDEIVRCYPEPITREELGERSGFTVSGGTFSDYLSQLRRNGLVEVNGDDVRATEVLFP